MLANACAVSSLNLQYSTRQAAGAFMNCVLKKTIPIIITITITVWKARQTDEITTTLLSTSNTYDILIAEGARTGKETAVMWRTIRVWEGMVLQTTSPCSYCSQDRDFRGPLIFHDRCFCRAFDAMCFRRTAPNRRASARTTDWSQFEIEFILDLRLPDVEMCAKLKLIRFVEHVSLIFCGFR